MLTTPDYTRVCEKIKRWRSRLKRAVTMLDKLERQKARLEKKAAAIQPKPVTLTEACDHIVSAIVQGHTFEQASDQVTEAVVAEHDLDIPGFLQREPKPDPSTEAFLKEKAEADKKKARMAKEKAKVRAEIKRADLTGQRRKMPLTGKAALAALR